MKNVLITGGAGYIGSILSRNLIQDPFVKKLRIFDSLLFKKNFLEHLKENPKFEFIHSDIRDYKALGDALNEADTVIHLAGLVGDPACAVNIHQTIEVNLLASKKLVELCSSKNNIKNFIFASTCSVYGASKDATMLAEDSPISPVSLYGETKKSVEEELLKNKHDFNFTLLRFGTAYGLSPRMRYDLVINSLCQKVFADKKINIFGGNQWRPFVHIEDIAKAIQLVMNEDPAKVAGQIFNVGTSEENYLLSDVGKLFKQVHPETEVVNLTENKDPRSYNVSFKKIEHVLNFKNDWDVKKGIKQIMDALQEGKFTDFQNDIYYNYKWS